MENEKPFSSKDEPFFSKDEPFFSEKKPFFDENLRKHLKETSDLLREDPKIEQKPNIIIQQSGCVGIFYPLVEKGKEVDKDQIIGYIESLKIKQEIYAQAKGIITKIFPKEGEPIEYKQDLFIITPA